MSLSESLGDIWSRFHEWLIDDAAGAASSGTLETAAICLTVSLFAFISLYLLGLLGKKISVVGAAGVVTVGLLLTVIVQHSTGLIGWLILGLRLTDVGATLFVIGEALMVAVMAYNALLSRQLVR